jgi:hypothetical protein
MKLVAAFPYFCYFHYDFKTENRPRHMSSNDNSPNIKESEPHSLVPFCFRLQQT